MTFSVVARSADGSSWGVAVASKFLAVGSVVPAAAAGVGAVATQADANTAYADLGLASMREGLSAPATLDRLLADDEGRDHRQVGVVDAAGRGASYTGSSCLEWAGGWTGDGVAVQGNVLAGEQVVTAMREAWTAAPPGDPLARRLLATLLAGDRAGGDRRGRQSAALYVVRTGAGYDGRSDVAVDLRVDDHADPVPELGRLLDLNDLYLTASTEEERVTVTSELRGELERLARAAGAPSFTAWVGTENYEMRVAADGSWVDRRVLAILRST